MEIKEFLHLMTKKKSTIFSIVAIFLAFSAVITFIQPLKYEAKSKLLVVQDFNGAVDPYTAAKSNEYLSSILVNITLSDVFFRDVMDSGFNIDQNYFPERADKRAKRWEETIDSSVINDTGIIAISVYHPDKYQLEQIARAVNYVLKTKNKEYHGEGDKVNIKVINEPVLSNWPTKPNIILNFGLSLALGIVLSLAYIYLFPEETSDVRFWPKFKRKEKVAYSNPKDEEDNWKSVTEVLRKAQDDYHRQPEQRMENKPAMSATPDHTEHKEISEYEKKHEYHPHQHNEVRDHGSMKNILN